MYSEKLSQNTKVRQKVYNIHMDILQDYYLNTVRRYPILKRDLLLKFHPDKFPINLKTLVKNDTNLNEYINFVFADLLEKYPIKCDTDFIKILNKNRQYIKYIPLIWLAIYNLDYNKVKSLLDDNKDPNTYVHRNDITKYIEINNSTKQSWRLEGNIINVLEFHLHIHGDYQSIKNILLLLLRNGNNEYVRLLEDIILGYKNIMHSNDLMSILLGYNISCHTKMYFNNKFTLLPFCVANGSIDQVKILFSKSNPNINYLDSQQNNLLHYAASRNLLINDDSQQSFKIITFLLSKKKWKLDKKNKDNMTALQVLESRSNVKKDFVKDISVLLKVSHINPSNNNSQKSNVDKNDNYNNNLHKYKKSFYNIQTGVRGGKYIVVNEKKIYIKRKKN